VFDRFGRDQSLPEVQQACSAARHISSHAYARSHFVPQADGTGLELMELCLPQVSSGRLIGYLVATYSLSELLASRIGPQLGRSQEVSFTEADGTRLAMHGLARRGTRVFTAQQLLDLPGSTMVLRLDSWRSQPDVFPNVLTALVTVMSIALVTVLFMLGHDTRRRLRVEQDLADALAFRKAMEDSLVTGLRARDLQGRTTYVNPAFCQMVGFPRKTCWGARHAGALTGRRSWPTNTASASRCGWWPATRRRARASNRCSCARTAPASRC
jgi:two-component system sensor histidine kinase DctS